MPLDGRSVVDFLLEHGALEPEDVLDRQLSVVELRRRNACFAVSRRGAAGLFVKQAGLDDPLNHATLHAEAELARAAAQGGALAPVARLGVPLRLFDAEQRVLVVDLVDGAEDLQVRARREGVPPPAVARCLGRAVGTLHRDVPAAAGAGRDVGQGWILSLADLEDHVLRGDAAAARHLRDVVRELPDLAAGLAELRGGWCRDTFIHGDLKWENVLVAGTGEEPRVHLVDWEMSGPGDAAWDVGGLLQAYVRHWIAGLPPDVLAGDGTSDAAPVPADVAPSVAALWEGYRAAARPADPDGLLSRSVRFAGARLLQTAYEAVAARGALSPHAVAFAQVAANVLARPSLAASTLLGIELDA